VSESLDEGIVLVLLKKSLVVMEDLLEVLHVSLLNTRNNLVIRSKSLLEVRV